MILYPATSAHNHSVSDFSGDWSTTGPVIQPLMDIRGKAVVFLRIAPASEKLEKVAYAENFRGGGSFVTILWRHKSKFCKITPKNTHFCAFWKQILV